ncbi:MAG: FliH/SctL family protein [Bacillota bacterium]|nr:FliH/SctL family protein [Bacillota bacterium]
MYNKVYKNYQINVGLPFQLNQALNFETVKRIDEEFDDNDKVLTINEPEDVVTREEILENAREEADMIIKEAKYEAERIICEAERSAKENAAALEEEAKVKGFEEGYNILKQQYEDLMQEAEFTKEHARVEYKEVLESIESDAVNIVLDISKKVLGMEISSNKEVILGLIRQAFEKCSSKENVILKVSGEDYCFVTENKEQIIGLVEGIGELEIKKDLSLKAGGCVIETPYGTIDASLQTKFNKIEDAFRSLIHGR